MIRKYTEDDMDTILEIWLSASIQAHGFISAEFWQANLENMRNIYLPASEVYVYELNSDVVGFYALHQNSLAALFVKPKQQGNGIGKQLLTHAKNQRPILTLCVYKENQASYQFYLSQSFRVIAEKKDEHTGYPEYVMSTKV